MDGRIERLLEQVGLKQEEFPNGFDNVFRWMDSYNKQNFKWQEYDLKKSPLRIEDIIEPNGVFYRGSAAPLTWTLNLNTITNKDLAAMPASDVVRTFNFQYDEV
jgi:hypothetical protein